MMLRAWKLALAVVATLNLSGCALVFAATATPDADIEVCPCPNKVTVSYAGRDEGMLMRAIPFCVMDGVLFLVGAKGFASAVPAPGVMPVLVLADYALSWGAACYRAQRAADDVDTVSLAYRVKGDGVTLYRYDRSTVKQTGHRLEASFPRRPEPNPACPRPPLEDASATGSVWVVFRDKNKTRLREVQLPATWFATPPPPKP